MSWLEIISELWPLLGVGGGLTALFAWLRDLKKSRAENLLISAKESQQRAETEKLRDSLKDGVIALYKDSLTLMTVQWTDALKRLDYVEAELEKCKNNWSEYFAKRPGPEQIKITNISS